MAGQQTDVSELEGLDRRALALEWGSIFKTTPPKAASRSLLLMAVSYEVQKKASGDLSKSDHRNLKAALRGEPLSTVNNVAAGAVLMREWQGQHHRVDVMKDGYVYKDEVWSSLSAIAKHITGTKWSGPSFFGVS